MSVNTDVLAVDVVVACNELLSCNLLVGKAIVAQVAVTEVMVPLRTVGVSAAVTNGDDDEAHLCKAVNAVHAARPALVHSLGLWTGIYILDKRIALCRVKVEWLLHYTVEVGNAVGSFHRETLGELVACSK